MNMKGKHMKKKLIVPIFLAAMALPVCLNKGAQGVNADWIGEYTKSADYLKYGVAINGQMADEGFVLLKNRKNDAGKAFLPMVGNEKISLVGKNSVKYKTSGSGSKDIARGGGGSGDASPSSGVTALDFEQSLKNAGFQLNQTALDFYKSTESGSGRTNGNSSWKGNSEVTIGETDIEKVKNKAGLLDSLTEYGAAAVQVLTREGSEGCDVKTCNAHDSIKTNTSAKQVSDRHALQLSANEEALFNELKNHTDNIIIVINSSNIFECDALQKDPKVAAILWVGNVGDVGAGAVGRILKGEVNPSGRTVDTWTRDFTKDPTFQNFSDNSQTNLVTDKNGDKIYAPQDTMFAADGAPMMSFGTKKDYNDHSKPKWDNARGGEEFKVVEGGINGVKPASYVSYEEGIYLDYRYYETRYADMAADKKQGQAAADEWYNGQEGVVYPFGYGLSYTTFTQEIVKANIKKGGKINEKNEVISFTVKVTNTGDRAGKDAVQLYWKAPYKKGGIEKADHVLCAFDKSKMLEPGQSQEISLSFHLQDVANYDFSDANKNKFCGYELDSGKYSVLLSKNAHEAYESFDFQVSKNIKYKTDRFSGNEVKNRFTDRGWYSSMPGKDDIEFTQMSRADFVGTFPTHPTIEDRTVKQGSKFEEFLTHKFYLGEVDVDHNYDIIPQAAARTEQDAINGGWEQAAKAKAKNTGIQLIDMKNVPLTGEIKDAAAKAKWEGKTGDQAWTEFINEFTYDELLKYIEQNAMASIAQDNIGKPRFSEGDGPQKLKSAGGIMWVSSPIIAATFNPELAHKQGECVGMESNIGGESGWWGPAVNTHRSPFGGRNFEYYSADPFLMGRMAANVVGAAADRGLYAYFKHFAVNDQEKNRESGISFVNEQALREIYLKSFQMVFEEGKSIGVMGSYNRVGLMETAASYPLMTEILRGEWGFKGSVLSDMTHSGNTSVDFRCYETVDNRAVAGCNCQLDSGGFKGYTECKWDANAFNGKGAPTSTYTKADGEKVTFTSYTWWNACRERVKEHLYMSVNCNGVLKKADYYVTVKGEEYKEVEARTDFEYEVKIDGAASYRLNERVELPKGITFENGKLSGKFEQEGVYHLDFIGMDADGKSMGAFKLIVTATTGNVQNFVKGCFGDIAAVGAVIGLVALAGAGLMLVSLRKKRRA